MTHQQRPDNSQSPTHRSCDRMPPRWAPGPSVPQTGSIIFEKNRLNLACCLGVDLGVFKIFVWGGEGESDVFVKTLTVELLGQMAPVVQCSGYTSCFSLDNPEHSACKPLLVFWWEEEWGQYQHFHWCALELTNERHKAWYRFWIQLNY